MNHNPLFYGDEGVGKGETHEFKNIDGGIATAGPAKGAWTTCSNLPFPKIRNTRLKKILARIIVVRGKKKRKLPFS